VLRVVLIRNQIRPGGKTVAGWVVVMTKPNCENMAVANLTQQGFLCYFPRFKDARPNKPVLIKPLFPRYIFTVIDRMWYAIRGTRGVSYLLMGEDGPAKVSTAVIDAIRSREDGEGLIQLSDKQEARFRLGMKVKAINGPLADKLLIYDGMTAHDRVKVLVNILGCQCPGTIDEKSLVAA